MYAVAECKTKWETSPKMLKIEIVSIWETSAPSNLPEERKSLYERVASAAPLAEKLNALLIRLKRRTLT